MSKSLSHVIDQKAEAILKDVFAKEGWQLYDISPDYAVDHILEIVESDGQMSGDKFSLQLKGVENFPIARNGHISFPLQTKHLKRWMRIREPVLLVVIGVSTRKGVWLFIQKYIRDLPSTTKWESKKTFSVKIPLANEIIDHTSLQVAVREAIKYVARSDPFVLEPQFDQVRALIQNYDVITARDLLQSIERLLPPQLPPALQCRRIGLSATIEGQLGNSTAARDLHLQASAICPDPAEKKRQEILAFIAGNDDKEAEKAIIAAHSAYPEYPRIASLWVQVMARDHSIPEILGMLSKELLSNNDVQLGLTRASLFRNDVENAERFARQGLAARTGEAFALFADAIASRISGVEPNDQPVEGVTEAIEMLRRIMPRVPDQALRKWELCRTLGVLLSAAGNDAEANTQFETAFHLNPQDPHSLRLYAMGLAKRSDLNGALAVLEAYSGNQEPSQNRFLKAQLRVNRNEMDDRKVAVTIIKRELATENLPSKPRIEWLTQLIRLQIHRKELVDAESLLTAPEATQIAAGTIAILRALLAQAQDQTEAAKQFAHDAISSLSSITHADLVVDLGWLLEKWGDFQSALNVWKHALPSIDDDPTILHLLSVAGKCHEYGFILSYCSKRRLEKGYEGQFIAFEINAQAAISPTKAVDKVQELLKQPHPPRVMRELRFRMSLLGIATGRDDVIERNADNLPKASEATKFNVINLVQLLRITSDPMRAVDLAYQFYRKYPHAIESYKAIVAAINFGEDSLKIPQPELAGKDAAVTIQFDEGQSQTFVLEEEDPNSFLGEISPSSATGAALLGKAVNDSVTLPLPFSGTRLGTIKSIDHKYVHCYRKLFEEVANLPEQHVIQQFKTPFGADGQPDLTELLFQLRALDDRQNEKIGIYREKFIPIEMLAKSLGQSIVITMNNLAASRDAVMRCALGNEEEIQASQQAFHGATEAVVDITALVAAVLMRGWFGVDVIETILTSIPNLAVSEFTLLELEWASSQLRDGRLRLGAVVKGSAVTPSVQSSEAFAPAANAADEVIAKVRRHCNVVQGVSLDDCPAEIRSLLLDCCGKSSLCSMLVAKNRGGVYWTDDLALGLLSNHYFGCKRIWTQSIASSLHDKKILTQQQFGDLTLAFLRLRFDFIRISSESALYAAKTAKWNAHSQPLLAVTEQLGSSRTGPEGIVGLARALLKSVWEETLLQNQARDFTFALLSQIKRHPLGFKIIRTLHVSIDGLFGLNVLRAGAAKQAIEVWIAANR